ncbi:DUF397 domain-containing protein [Kitasatospora sp. NPDC057692]|uniref:DUF397 domain-containing protein n=1 Tax=Kitasatospora sp. NPDC057692 TaxID=3346215 RepID=UPI00368A0AC6
MTVRDTADRVWHKSTYSGPDNECVEVANGLLGVVPVRDSKDPEGPALLFTAEEWAAFVVGLKAGEFPLA